MMITDNTIQSNDISAMPSVLRKMKLSSMAKALEEKLNSPNCNLFAVQSEFSEIILAEFNTRRANKINKLIKDAGLKMPDADIEDLYTDCGRSMNMDILNQMMRCDWIKNKNNLIITGGSGSGKTWVGCAIAARACELSKKVRFYTLNSLLLYMKTLTPQEYLKEVNRIVKYDLLILDDVGFNPYDLESCRIFFEVLDARYKNGSIMFISNYTTDEWYDKFAEHAFAEAVLSRCIERSFHLPIQSEDLRKTLPK